MTMPDGTVRAIEVDNYSVVKTEEILVKYYCTREQVEALINLGHLASLGPQIELDPNTILPPRDKLLSNVTVAYHRDYGDPYTPPVVFENGLLYQANGLSVFGATFILLFYNGIWYETCYFKNELLPWVEAK